MLSPPIKVTTECDPANSTELEKEVDQDIAQFDIWFQSITNDGPLAGSEKAIIKTYLFFKTRVKQEEKT